MESQKTTTVGIALIMLVFFVWFFYNQPNPAPPKPKAVATDTASAVSQAPVASTSPTPASDTSHSQGAFASAAQAVPAVEKIIETPLYTAKLSSKGGAISSFILHDFVTYTKAPLDLVNQKDYHGGDVNLKFVSTDGKTVATNDLPFELDPKSLSLRQGDSMTVSAIYRLDSGRSIEKQFHFTGGRYLVGVEFKLTGLQNTVNGYHYTASLDNPIPFLEKSSSDEATNAKAFAGVAGDIEDIVVNKNAELTRKPVNGDISYIGERNQYFLQALIPIDAKANGAELVGKGSPASDGGVVAKYSVGMNVPIKHLPVEGLAFKMYLGPLDYERVSELGVGLERSMNFGWSFLVRPISIHIMMPLFMWLHSFISNWGLVIIVFSILIKLLTVPLSTGQMRSMRKMQVLQPKVTEVREKYKDDAKKMNEELLKLYRTYGVNPAGGCLPMVLQMPILFALYAVLRNVIQLRQAPFGLWIHDLSVPDSLFHFGTKLPLIGEQLSGLTLLLVITMFLQQYFTVTDPRQKQMAYIMPIVFTFMFNNLPSGVALYYFMFNIFGLCQQLYLTKIAKPMTLEQMKVDPKKASGGLMARLQDMEKNQRAVRKDQYTGKTPKKR